MKLQAIPMEKIALVIDLKPENLALLKQLASQQGVTQSEIIERLIESQKTISDNTGVQCFISKVSFVVTLDILLSKTSTELLAQIDSFVNKFFWESSDLCCFDKSETPEKVTYTFDTSTDNNSRVCKKLYLAISNMGAVCKYKSRLS